LPVRFLVGSPRRACARTDPCQPQQARVTLRGMSKKALWKWTAGILALVALFGCASESMNLTPKKMPRSTNGYYHFETAWESDRRGVRTNVQAYVMIETNLFPMQPVPLAQWRYEAFVPLPAGKTYFPYRYRFDFEYLGVGKLVRDSELSPSYRLIVPLESNAPIQSNEPGK
jgi:hypothetical protein